MPSNQTSRMENLIRSEIRNMSVACDKVNGINLAQGICDFPLNSFLFEGAKQAMSDGQNHYTRHDGIDCLRKAISKKSQSYNGIKSNPETDIVVSSGATGAFYSACFALLSPGDEMILFEPFYGYHEYTLQALNINPLYVKLNLPDWTLDIDVLEKKVSNKTRAIMINTPLNPAGKVFSRQEIELLADFCIKHDLLIFTDEIYEYILYDGRKHISPGSVERIKDRVITISGYSKTFSITGWRIGYCIANEEMAKKIGYASDLIYVCAPSPLQFAVANAINNLEQSYYEKLIVDFTYKRNLLCSTLTEVGLPPFIPQGAYYVLTDITKLRGNTSKEKVLWLLDKSGVAIVPGSSFFHNEEDGNLIARFCFAKENNVIESACDKLRKCLI